MPQKHKQRKCACFPTRFGRVNSSLVSSVLQFLVESPSDHQSIRWFESQLLTELLANLLRTKNFLRARPEQGNICSPSFGRETQSTAERCFESIADSKFEQRTKEVVERDSWESREKQGQQELWAVTQALPQLAWGYLKRKVATSSTGWQENETRQQHAVCHVELVKLTYIIIILRTLFGRGCLPVYLGVFGIWVFRVMEFMCLLDVCLVLSGLFISGMCYDVWSRKHVLTFAVIMFVNRDCYNKTKWTKTSITTKKQQTQSIKRMVLLTNNQSTESPST
jgi:hypothetical protein